MNPTYQTAMQMVQLMLQRYTTVTKELIATTVDEVLSMPTFGQGVARGVLIAELEERFTVWTDDAKVLGKDDDHLAWLPGKRGNIEWAYWNRYKLHMTNRLPPAAVESIEKVTDEILGRLEDPVRPGPWDRRGLVMGHVQSGKTGNYTGLICKAADAGYKVVIVLAGMHNNLRSQTQVRLDEGFLGYRATAIPNGQGAFEPTGVGVIDPSIRADSVTNRHDNGDFRGVAAKQFAISPGGRPLLFVVKKNVSVLKNLLDWIRGSANMTDPISKRKFHQDVPLLVIDDEADQASVDTKTVSRDEYGNPDPDHDPTKTNSLIRQLLYSFGKSAYVGYTATPFANIFIHERNKTTKEGEDLFPRSFIVNIPPPSNYTGAARIFGINEDSNRGIEEIAPLPICRAVEDHSVRRGHHGEISENGHFLVDETEGWMPPRLVDRTQHIPIFDGDEQIPPSMERALKSFILSTAVREIREGLSCHNSMLVHVARFTDVQARVSEQVARSLDQMRARLKHGDGSRTPSITDEFEELWLNDYVKTSDSGLFKLSESSEELELPAWADIKATLWSVVSSIEIRTINGTAGDVLDYESHIERGLNVIAIGGDKLSRGLTLEGLTVSYFLRASKMYDTLMQMGRWFGYKSHYVDVCRLYTTEDLIEWFTHIAGATEELREEFDYMVNVGGSPRDYGLKVRSHPVLLVTSAVKMRSGTQMSLSYAGDISETIMFDADTATVQKNFQTTTEWLTHLGTPGTSPAGDSSHYWAGVSSDEILDYLGRYKFHKDAKRVDASLLSRYISKQAEQGELTNWSVLLVSPGRGESTELAGIGKVGLTQRAQFPISAADDKNRQKYTIRRLVNPSDESADLSRDPVSGEWESALANTIENWRKKDSKKPGSKPTRPGGREIREIRPITRGLLIIYLLDSDYGKLESTVPVTGIALSFPSSSSAERVSYTVNNVFTNAGDVENI